VAARGDVSRREDVATVLASLADMPPLADVLLSEELLPAFCSWLIGGCALCACLSLFCSFATAASENIAAATATAMGVIFMVSFPVAWRRTTPT
jgi:hypothetical protein